MVYNGKPSREWLSREDTASPCVSLEGLFLTTVIDAKEQRDMMSCDIPNAFIQANAPKLEGDEKIIMKITGVLVDMLVQIAPEIYGSYVVYEHGKKVLYVEVLKALYGMLQSSLLWYAKFRADLEKEGFEFNAYDPCVANRMINGEQHTIRYHVDDVLSSHMHPEVNDKFLKWLNKKYGSYGEVKAKRGDVHDYLGMKLDFREKGKVKIDMTDYVKEMVDSFPKKFYTKDTAPTPATKDLFTVGNEKPLPKDKKETFHTYVAKGLFVSKRARPDIQPTNAFLCTRVQDPNEGDWEKLVRMMKYLNGTRNDALTLAADDLQVVKWYIDASFATHPDFKSHTGGNMTYGKGAPIAVSRKHKLNTRSSAEAELVASDDLMTLILWTRLFLEEQGISIKENIIYQDNMSTIKLQENGKSSSGQRTRALNIRYFFLTDQIKQGKVKVKYCPTEEMWADFLSKPLQGQLFVKFKKLLMGQT